LPAVQLSLYAVSADSGASQTIVRGIRGNNKIVLMWNGQRLNHPDAQPLPIIPYLYPLNDIDRVEILYGSASALYGSDTVSMTVNMISSPLSHEGESQWRLGLDSGRYHELKACLHYSGWLGKVATEFLLDWHLLDNGLIFYLKALYTGKASYHPENYRLSASDNRGRQFTMPAYWRLDFGRQYKLSGKVSLHFDISNLLDKKYDQPIVGQETSSWTRIAATPGLPRQYYVGIKARF